MKPFRICYIINAFQSPVVEEALLVLANNNFSLFLTDVNIECMNFYYLELCTNIFYKSINKSILKG